MLYGGNFDSRRVRGFKWGGDTGLGDKSTSMSGGLKDKSTSMGGGLKDKTKPSKSTGPAKKAGYDFGMLGAIGSAITGLMDGTLSFSDQTSALQQAQRAKTANRSGGPGADGERRLPPQTLPSIAAAAAAPTSPEALRKSVDFQNYFSDLQRIALGESDSQAALARFGIAPEQSYFQYRESFPEFGDLSGTPGGLAGIIRSLGSMSRTAESFAEGGRVGESMGRRDIQTDVGKFGQMLRDLMLMTDEPTGRQAERLAMAEEAGYVSPAIAQREGALYQPGGLMPRVDRTIEVSPLPPPGMTREMTQRKRQNNSGLMPRDLSIDVSQMPMSGMLQDKAQREKLLSENRNQNITEAVSPGMSRERTQRERELSRPRNQRDLESLIEALRKEPASSLVDFNEAEDLEEQDPDAYNALFPDQGDTQTQMFDFISRLEGSETEGYVVRDPEDPDKALDQSGVAIATGLDFGQHDEQSLRNMGLTEDLIERFRPYLGKQGDLAISFLADNPLTITDEENKFIQNKLNEYEYNNLRRIWNSSEDTSSSFEELTPEQQTVLLSVYRQYGNLATATPIFWAAASSGDWDAATAELRDFKGPTPDRRDQEADLLDNGFLYAHGGPVSSRNRALPMVEGDHVVPAKAVKGNEGGLASLSRRLSGNPSYDGMIRGPGGPREDAIKTRVYATGGGISGMMDNLQNPFNSVPARVSNKEYVIPRDAINNLGRMAGVSEGMANKAGQDIIYQLVENLKRKA